MTIFTKLTLKSPDRPIPSEIDIQIGIPADPVAAARLLAEAGAGHTKVPIQLELGEEVNGEQEFSIIRKWYDLDAANAWCAFMTELQTLPGFISCTVVVTE